MFFVQGINRVFVEMPNLQYSNTLFFLHACRIIHFFLKADLTCINKDLSASNEFAHMIVWDHNFHFISYLTE